MDASVSDPPTQDTGGSAFTVLEFLVLVAVVAVVVVLLLPKYNEYAERRRRAACASNLRQMGIALLAYAGDHTRHLPTLENNAHGRTWDAALLAGDYLRPGVLHCPSDTCRRPAGVLPRSYAISAGEKKGPGTFFWIHGANLDCRFLTNATEIALVTERLWGNTQSSDGKERGNWCDKTWISSAHFRRTSSFDPSAFIRETNYLFLDGHVAWLKEPTDRMFPPNPTGKSVPCP